MNQISQRQNQEHFLQYLAAQRQLYDEAKRWTAIWMLAVMCVAILGTSAFAFFVPFTPFITWITLLIVICEFAFLPTINKRRKDAAKIQELFDCELLELNWNEALGKKPKQVTISAAVERFRKQRNQEDWEKLKNWYNPKVGLLPLHQARVACQKENIWWDEKLRREYLLRIYWVLIIFFVLLITLSIIANWSFQQLFTGPLLLSLPFLAMTLKHALDHRKAAEQMFELREFADDLLKEASSETADLVRITQRSRELQNEIFHRRAENQPVFSWFYSRLQKKYERFAESSIFSNNT